MRPGVACQRRSTENRSAFSGLSAGSALAGFSLEGPNADAEQAEAAENTWRDSPAHKKPLGVLWTLCWLCAGRVLALSLRPSTSSLIQAHIPV